MVIKRDNTGAKIQKIIQRCTKNIQFLFIFLNYITFSIRLAPKNMFFYTNKYLSTKKGQHYRWSLILLRHSLM